MNNSEYKNVFVHSHLLWRVYQTNVIHLLPPSLSSLLPVSLAFLLLGSTQEHTVLQCLNPLWANTTWLPVLWKVIYSRVCGISTQLGFISSISPLAEAILALCAESTAEAITALWPVTEWSARMTAAMEISLQCLHTFSSTDLHGTATTGWLQQVHSHIIYCFLFMKAGYIWKCQITLLFWITEFGLHHHSCSYVQSVASQSWYVQYKLVCMSPALRLID